MPEFTVLSTLTLKLEDCHVGSQIFKISQLWIKTFIKLGRLLLLIKGRSLLSQIMVNSSWECLHIWPIAKQWLLLSSKVVIFTLEQPLECTTIFVNKYRKELFCFNGTNRREKLQCHCSKTSTHPKERKQRLLTFQLLMVRQPEDLHRTGGVHYRRRRRLFRLGLAIVNR